MDDAKLKRLVEVGSRHRVYTKAFEKVLVETMKKIEEYKTEGVDFESMSIDYKTPEGSIIAIIFQKPQWRLFLLFVQKHHGFIGRGAFKTVVKSMDVYNEIIKAGGFIKCNQSNVQEIKREFEISNRFENSEFFIGHTDYHISGSVPRCYFVQDLFSGDMYSVIENQLKLKETTIGRIFESMVEAVKILHENGIFHRDIKPDNILFTGRIDVESTLKFRLGDMGLCQDNVEGVAKHVGTPIYWAPEVFMRYTRKLPSFPTSESQSQADIFALGLTIKEIQNFKIPKFAQLGPNYFNEKYKVFPPDYNLEVLTKKHNKDYPKKSSDGFNRLIWGLIQPIPRYRPTIAPIYKATKAIFSPKN